MKEKIEYTLNDEGTIVKVRIPAGQYLARNLNMLFKHTTEAKARYMSVCHRCKRFYPTIRPTIRGYCPGCRSRMEEK